GEVREQLTNGDVGLAVKSEFGNVLGDRIVQANLAGFFESHDGCGGGNDLGERGDVEDGVDGHGLGLWLERAIAVGLAIDNFPVVPNQQDRSGNLLRGDGLFDDRVDRLQAGVVFWIWREAGRCKAETSYEGAD